MTDVIGQMLERLAAGGWDGLEPFGDVHKLQSEASAVELALKDREAAIAAAALDTPAGRELLDLLARKTVLRPPTLEEQSATEPMALAILAARRQGASVLFFEILAMLAHARHGVAASPARGQAKPQGGDG